MRTTSKRRKVIGFGELCSGDIGKDHGRNHETLFQCLVNYLIDAPTSSFFWEKYQVLFHFYDLIEERFIVEEFDAMQLSSLITSDKVAEKTYKLR